MVRSLAHSLVAAAAVSILGLAGCGGQPPKPEPDPTIVQLDLLADSSANADANGRGTPVVVRYYLLQSAAAFDGADFFSLFERDEALLGTATTRREQVTLIPGQKYTNELRPQGEANFLGVFVAYRDVNRTRWRATARIPQNKTSKYVIRVGRDGVSITPLMP